MRSFTRVVVATGVLVAGLVAAPAGAVAPVPTPPVPPPPALDNAAFYEAQTLCDPTPRPGATALGNLLVATYGPATVYIPRACTSSTSEHFDGRAVDWMRSVRVPAEKEMADAFVAWLLAPAADGTPHAMARRLGIMYIIWDNRMIRMYDPGRGWTEYRGCSAASSAGAGLDTTCHRNHVHLSLSWDGAAGITSWWTGVAQTQPFCSTRSTGAAPGAGSPTVVADAAAVPGLVPVPPTRVLDTAAGTGAGLAAPCRALAGRTLYPSATASGVVPAGAGAVALRVTSTSNAPALLTAWSSGASRPAGQVATPLGQSAATLLVPLASDGTIAVSTSLGAANVVADVVGYTAGPPSVVSPGEPAPIATRPGRPRTVRATAKPARRAVVTRWKAPTSTGGAPMSGYRVEALTSAKKGARVAGACTAGPTAGKCTVKGLKKGRKYWMSVSATNAVGTTWAPRRSVRLR